MWAPTHRRALLNYLPIAAPAPPSSPVLSLGQSTVDHPGSCGGDRRGGGRRFTLRKMGFLVIMEHEPDLPSGPEGFTVSNAGTH